MALPLDEGLALIKKAREAQQEEREFLQWVVQVPFMTKKTFVKYTDYRDNLHGANIDMRPKEVILAELDAIEEQFAKGGDTSGS